MRYALIDLSGAVLETGIKLTPFMPSPAEGCRWVIDPETPFDAETHTRTPDTVPDGAGELTYTIAMKPAGEYLAVMMKRAETAAQNHMDATARAMGYDSLTSAISYAEDDTNLKWWAEGRAFRSWRSAVWMHCHAVQADIEAIAVVPTMEEFIAGLPALVLPQ